MNEDKLRANGGVKTTVEEFLQLDNKEVETLPYFCPECGCPDEFDSVGSIKMRWLDEKQRLPLCEPCYIKIQYEQYLDELAQIVEW